MQRAAGVSDEASERAAAAFRDHLREQHRLFFPQLPFIVVGAVDPEGAPWATVQAGVPGFLSVPDPATLCVAAAREPADPADRGMEDGDAVGLLGIELPTRRRNRLNGTLLRDGPAGYAVAVEQSFGNCSRFIVPRHPVLARPSEFPQGAPARRGDGLDADARALVAAADTFFVASYVDGPDGRRQTDVSHRGGRASFVEVDEQGCLTIPDLPGNGFFNTLGNIRMTGRAGLLFVDFSTGDLLQLTGEADILPEGGQDRRWRVRPLQVVARPGAPALRWDA